MPRQTTAAQTKHKNSWQSRLKLRFAGFLRGLLRHLDDREPARPVAAPAPSAPAVPPVVRRRARAEFPGSGPRRPILMKSNCRWPAVVAALPMDLRAKLMASPPAGVTIHLPAETVISQLAFGAVKISFGELRQLAPGVFVNSGGELDNKLVSLPLNEILPRLNPALLARRAVKKVEVAAEISGPFAGRGRGFSFHHPAAQGSRRAAARHQAGTGDARAVCRAGHAPAGGSAAGRPAISAARHRARNASE